MDTPSSHDFDYSRANSQFKILSFATLGSNLSATYSKYKGSKSDHEAVRVAPLIPVYDVEGNWAGTKANGLGDSKNPVSATSLPFFSSKTVRWLIK